MLIDCPGDRGRKFVSPCTYSHSQMKKALIVLGTLLASCLALQAQVTLNFSGGSGSPLTVTVQNTVTFTLTGNGNKHDFFFFDVPGFTGPSEGSVSGTLSFTTNGGALNTFEMANGSRPSGFTGGISLWSNGSTWLTGDTVVLQTGSFTTAASYAGSLPSNGSYSVYLTDNGGTLISSAGVSAVPEPSTYAAIFGTLALGAVGVVRRRRAALNAQA